MKLTEIPMTIMRKMNLDVISQLEDALAARPDVVRAAADAPVRFEIMHEALKRGLGPPPSIRAMPHMAGSMSGIRRSLQTVQDNPAQPRTHIPEAELAELEAYARSVGVDDIGYTRLYRGAGLSAQSGVAPKRHRADHGDGQGPNGHLAE